MPALKRRAIASPDPRPPHPSKAKGYYHLSLRPSLRNYRDDIAASESDTDVAETDVELGTSLSALENDLDEAGDSDSDVESSLVLQYPKDIKGKGVDPREYGMSYRKPLLERAPYRRAMERRLVGRGVSHLLVAVLTTGPSLSYSCSVNRIHHSDHKVHRWTRESSQTL